MAITADIDETDRAGIALCANQVPGSSARSRLPWAGGSRCPCASGGGNQGHRSLTDLASCLRARKGALCRPVPTPITPKYATCSPHLGVRYPSRKQMVSPEAETPAVRRPGPGSPPSTAPPSQRAATLATICRQEPPSAQAVSGEQRGPACWPPWQATTRCAPDSARVSKPEPVSVELVRGCPWKADGAHRPSWRPDAARYMSADTATRGPTALQGDT